MPRRRTSVPTVQSVIQRAFAGGELAPALGARADQTKYLTGLKTCRNFLVQRHGGVTKRPGTRFVAAVKNAAVLPRLIPFIFEATDQTYLIEAGAGYFRFFWHGAPVVTGGGAIYEVASPYSAAEVARLQWTQSADVLTLTHPNHVPRELRRLAHTTWELVALTTQPTIDPPTGISATAGGTGPWPLIRYVVTAAKVGTFEESYSAGSASVTTGPPTAAAPNVLTWDPVDDAEEYWVYADMYGNGIFGFLGTAKTPTFRDVGFVPDFSITPPIPVTLFDAPETYPSTCVYFQQRLFFANAIRNRETVWGSQVGAYHNFSISTPLQDDDAVTFVLASQHLNPVAHLVGLKRLIVLTDEGEWVLHGDENGTVRPSTINADQEGYVGAHAAVRPVVVGNALLYVEARQPIVRELSFDANQGGRIGQDLTVFAPHLFTGYAIVDLGYAHAPHSIIWAVRDDGTLLGLTYLREHDVWGWHRHDTLGGAFEAVCVLPDTAAKEDVVYVVVRRTINGATVRYLERFAALQWATPADWFFVDAGLTYAGAAATTLTGLTHLAGQVVAVLGDGAVVYDGDPAGAQAATFTVSPTGTLTLPVAVATAQVGLPMRFADIETLDLDVEGTAVRDKAKRVQRLTALVEATPHGFLAGPDADHLIAERPELWEAAPTGVTGQLAINLTCSFSTGGRVILRSPEPVPCTILGVIPQLEVGG